MINIHVLPSIIVVLVHQKITVELTAKRLGDLPETQMIMVWRDNLQALIRFIALETP